MVWLCVIVNDVHLATRGSTFLREPPLSSFAGVLRRAHGTTCDMPWPNVRDTYEPHLVNGEIVVLGKGSTSVVEKWKWKNRDSPGFVAIKFVTGCGNNDENKAQVEAEAQSHGRLRGDGEGSEYVIKPKETVQDRDVTPPRLGLVLEYFDGKSLAERLRGNAPIDEDVFRPIFKKIMLGVFFFHRCDISHRDLKPHDVLVDENNERLKIIDFGCSKHTQTRTGTRTGTREYCAPEVFMVDRQIGYWGYKADIWSCGVMLYAVLCGKLPFINHELVQPDRVVEALENFKYARFPEDGPFARLSFNCTSLIRQMLAVDPEQRPSAQQVLEHDWMTCSRDGFHDLFPSAYPPEETFSEELFSEFQEIFQESQAPSQTTDLSQFQPIGNLEYND
mmetsp:Transcript_1712/g.6793  ORF Transcript_1712/g.6793 Transcript_1712/m.6793 type:complete len:390 (-) Transcript_1712:527-1696(-)